MAGLVIEQATCLVINALLYIGRLLKGNSDLFNAKRAVNSEGPYDMACFHVQQAVEKYLKLS